MSVEVSARESSRDVRMAHARQSIEEPQRRTALSHEINYLFAVQNRALRDFLPLQSVAL